MTKATRFQLDRHKADPLVMYAPQPSDIPVIINLWTPAAGPHIPGGGLISPTLNANRLRNNREIVIDAIGKARRK